MASQFSRQAGLYARYRPRYPAELFEFILQHVPARETAWDCATGNGQTALELATRFKTVYATDISQEQLDQAPRRDNIRYSRQPAEKTDLPDHCFDLITVSQALHWLRFDEFFREVKRVANRQAIFAAWMYDLPQIAPGIDELIGSRYDKEMLGPYWDKERQHIRDHYQSIPFPFREIDCPGSSIQIEWTREELGGFLNSWSALQKYVQDRGVNPVQEIMEQILPLWTGEKMKVRFPLFVRMGWIGKSF